MATRFGLDGRGAEGRGAAAEVGMYRARGKSSRRLAPSGAVAIAWDTLIRDGRAKPRVTPWAPVRATCSGGAARPHLFGADARSRLSVCPTRLSRSKLCATLSAARDR